MDFVIVEEFMKMEVAMKSEMILIFRGHWYVDT